VWYIYQRHALIVMGGPPRYTGHALELRPGRAEAGVNRGHQLRHVIEGGVHWYTPLMAAPLPQRNNLQTQSRNISNQSCHLIFIWNICTEYLIADLKITLCSSKNHRNYPPLSIARHSFTQLWELKQYRVNNLANLTTHDTRK